MDVNATLVLLGGLSPAAFMRRHWQKKPLLVRQAWPGVQPPLGRAEMFELAARDGVESRLVRRDGTAPDDRWRVRHGPLPRRALPPARRPGWTLLLQGLDLHVPAAQAMLQRFAFLPHARLDDLMISWASPDGGVGPHLDSYDVFLLQVHGKRRWRVGQVAGAGQAAWRPGLPLKILRSFEPVHDWVLEPGDMLYLPPQWAHDGVAVGADCMTCSVGFRAPAAQALAAELLQRLADAADDADADGGEANDHQNGHENGDAGGEGDGLPSPPARRPGQRLYRDPGQMATANPGAIPPGLDAFARAAVERLLAQPGALSRALGEVLSEPKPHVWFEAQRLRRPGQGLCLAAGTRMVYDARHVYINGESFRAGGRDARVMQRLADARALSAVELARLSPGALALVDDWAASGWLLPEEPPEEPPADPVLRP